MLFVANRFPQKKTVNTFWPVSLGKRNRWYCKKRKKLFSTSMLIFLETNAWKLIFIAGVNKMRFCCAGVCMMKRTLCLSIPKDKRISNNRVLWKIMKTISWKNHIRAKLVFFFFFKKAFKYEKCYLARKQSYEMRYEMNSINKITVLTEKIEER